MENHITKIWEEFREDIPPKGQKGGEQMKYAIETFNLTKKYGDFTAVDRLNMKIENKTIFRFLGPNGAGKQPR